MILFKDSTEQELSVKIKKVTKEKLKLKELENGQTFEINLKILVVLIETFIPIKARYNTTILGAILAGGYIASVGNWDGNELFCRNDYNSISSYAWRWYRFYFGWFSGYFK